jgi:hypothetical protein
MTAVGKIFVILNVLLSLVVCGFIVAVYAQRTKWANATKEWQGAYEVADKSRLATEQELQRVRDQAAKDVQAAQGEVTKRDDIIKTKDAEVASVKAKLEAIEKAGTGDNASLKAVTADRDRLKDEIGGLEKQIADKNNTIVELTKKKNEANAEMVAAQIKASTFQSKAASLEQRVRETETEIVKLRRTGGGGGGVSVVSTQYNPPPQNVEGIITKVNGSLYKLSIGSDAGLERGHTLDVFRLTPTPQYLGQVRLTDVRASESVATPVDRLKYPVREGDMVSSDVLPKK